MPARKKAASKTTPAADTGLLGGERAAYGGEIVVTLSRQLAADHGRGFEEKNLRRMAQFSEVFPDEEIVAMPWRQFDQRRHPFLVCALPVASGQRIPPTLLAESSPQSGNQGGLDAAETLRLGATE